MKLINVNVYAEAYRSGATREENYFITKDTYYKMKDDIDAIEIYYSELDGKHSEVLAKTSIREYTEQELLEIDPFNDFADDGDSLHYTLEDIFNKYDLDLEKEQRVINEYLNSLDYLVTVEIIVKKSEREMILNQFDCK